jgi:hypothetical protein
MGNNTLGTVTIEDYYLGRSAISQSTNHCSHITHEIFACLNIQRSIMFPDPGKFKNSADPFKIGVDIDFDLVKGLIKRYLPPGKIH